MRDAFPVLQTAVQNWCNHETHDCCVKGEATDLAPPTKSKNFDAAVPGRGAGFTWKPALLLEGGATPKGCFMSRAPKPQQLVHAKMGHLVSLGHQMMGRGWPHPPVTLGPQSVHGEKDPVRSLNEGLQRRRKELHTE